MKRILPGIIAVLLISNIKTIAQTVTDPLITKWKLNTTNNMINGILTDVSAVNYDANYVYVSTSGIPSYYSFNNPNVNDAADGHFVWKFTRNPQQNTGTATSALTGGQMGAFIDGDPIFNAEDARSYQNANIWHQLAFYFEFSDFDTTWGHSTPTNVYHHHVVNLSLVDTSVTNVHSPLIGFMFDGFPLYGPFGYSDPNDAGSSVKRMASSYAFRSISQRTTLPDSTTLQPSQYGPAISTQYPLGCYREDYVYTVGSGDLDAHNGRFCKTPEYPNGIYAYFCTMDSANMPRYPYTIGQSFYGVITNGNMGPNGGQTSVPGGTTLYVPSTTTAINKINGGNWMVFPNPTKDILYVRTTASGNYHVTLTGIEGREYYNIPFTDNMQQLDMSLLSAGAYIISVTDNTTGKTWVNRCLKLQ